MVYDFICSHCGEVKEDVFAASVEQGPLCCNSPMDWKPSMRQAVTPVHSSESTVVYRNPRTGKVMYPMRNDMPLNPKLAAQGYTERVEMRHDHEVKRFEKENGVRNERAWFDRNGRGAELPVPEAYVPEGI